MALVAELLTERATLKTRVADLLSENAALKAQWDQMTRDSKRPAAPFSTGQRKANPKPPGRKPGQGRFTFRTRPTPDQGTAAPIEVRLPDPSCPGWGQRLRERRVEVAALTDLLPQPKPIVQPSRVWAVLSTTFCT